MKKLSFVFLFFVFSSSSFSQTLKKFEIAASGCSVYSFCDPGKFELTYSEDSAKVYTSECKNDDIYYGIICISLKNDIAVMADAEAILISYLDFLKSAFKIKSAVGYGKGHRLKGKENTRGIVDFWKDEEKNNWKVKGWTDGKFIAVLYAYSLKDLPEQKVNIFLDGITLKGM